MSHARLNLSPVIISRTKNDKLDVYLRVVRPPGNFSEKTPLLEFQLGDVDGRALFVAFQLEPNAPILAGYSEKKSDKSPGRNVVARRLFLEKIMSEAARRMKGTSFTAQSGLPNQWMAVDGSFHIPATEFPEYCDHLAAILEEVSCRSECGIAFLRFYTCSHGMRLACHVAPPAITAIADVDHPHIDVVQVHRADQLLAPHHDNMVVRIGGRGKGTLSSKLPRAYTGKLERYRCGYLSNYGYFRKHCSLRDEPSVTFVQAYNAAVKKARPTAMTSFVSAVFCRPFVSMPRYEDATRTAVKSATSLIEFFEHDVRCNAHLRLEEIHTIDPSTCHRAVSEEIQRLGSCDTERNTHTLDMLLDSGLLFRFAHWQRHVDETVGRDIELLAHHTEQELLSQLTAQPVIPLQLMTILLRCEFRLHYFAHGHNYNYNYAVVRHMLIGGNEAKATDVEWVRVRPAIEEDDEFVFPLYSPKTPVHLIYPIRCLWAVRHMLGDDAAADPLTYVVTAYAVWAYSTFLAYGLRQIAKEALDYSEIAADVIATEDPPFSLQSLLQAAACAGRATTVRIAQTRRLDTLVKELLHRPVSAFAQALSCTMPPLEEEFEQDLRLYLHSQVRVFPLGLVSTKSQETRPIVMDHQPQRVAEKHFRGNVISSLAQARDGSLRAPDILLRVADLENTIKPKRSAAVSTPPATTAKKAPTFNTRTRKTKTTKTTKTTAQQPKMQPPPTTTTTSITTRTFPTIEPPVPTPPPMPSTFDASMKHPGGRPKKRNIIRRPPISRKSDTIEIALDQPKRSERIRKQQESVVKDFTALRIARQTQRHTPPTDDAQQI